MCWSQAPGVWLTVALSTASQLPLVGLVDPRSLAPLVIIIKSLLSDSPLRGTSPSVDELLSHSMGIYCTVLSVLEAQGRYERHFQRSESCGVVRGIRVLDEYGPVESLCFSVG